MLEKVVATQKDLTICTVYDCIPGLEPMAHTALSMFKEMGHRYSKVLQATVNPLLGPSAAVPCCNTYIIHTELTVL